MGDFYSPTTATAAFDRVFHARLGLGRVGTPPPHSSRCWWRARQSAAQRAPVPLRRRRHLLAREIGRVTTRAWRSLRGSGGELFHVPVGRGGHAALHPLRRGEYKKVAPKIILPRRQLTHWIDKCAAATKHSLKSGTTKWACNGASSLQRYQRSAPQASA